jgi:hypothetical protein
MFTARCHLNWILRKGQPREDVSDNPVSFTDSDWGLLDWNLFQSNELNRCILFFNYFIILKSENRHMVEPLNILNGRNNVFTLQ